MLIFCAINHLEVKDLPIYEYECTCCSSRFEKKQSFSDDDPVSCPRCGSKTQRIFSPVPIIFKGSGFYVTDSRNSSSHALALPESVTDKAKTSSSDVTKTGITNGDKASSTDKSKAGTTEKDR